MNAPFDKASAKVNFNPPNSEACPSESLRRMEGASNDALWTSLRAEAVQGYAGDALLTPLYAAVFQAGSFEEALVSRLAIRLGHSALPAEELKAMLLKAILADASIGEAARADITAVVERDPASGRLLEPFLFFKGYAAIQTHRFAHWFWNAGRRDLARYLQSRSSEIFQTDIHPGAQFGKGVFLDHATGFVAGETVVIEDNVSILHGVTLGGTGTQEVARHPKIRTGVLIGAGAQIIGDVEVGAYSKIAAGSLVTENVPPRCTAVGVQRGSFKERARTIRPRAWISGSRKAATSLSLMLYRRAACANRIGRPRAHGTRHGPPHAAFSPTASILAARTAASTACQPKQMPGASR